MSTITKDASLDAIGDALEATSRRQRAAFSPAEQYADEQRGTDAEDNTEDMG